MRQSGIFKKKHSFFWPGDITKSYEVIEALPSEYPVRVLCSVLNIGFGVFYAWKRSETYVLGKAKKDLAEQVKVVFDDHRSRYGAIRISKELQSRGVKIGRQQTQTLMRIQNLKAIQPKRRFAAAICSKNHRFKP